MAIGRPISLTPNIATKNISSVATANQTEFTVTGGYRINELAVYRNGVRLAQGRDFTANDGTTVTLTNGATVNDVIEFVVFDSFNVAGTIVSAASSQNLNGDFNVTGKLYGGTVDTDSLKIGVGTFASAVHVGTALTADAAGNVNTVGMITAASFSGSGANLTGVASTDNIITGTAATFTNTGVNAGVPNLNVVGLATVGIITAYGALEGTTGTFSGALSGSTGTFSGAVNIDATTDSTSSSTGALIVDGGLGVAKNVYIGAGLSVAGTLTYEDVTNVDSVGVVTAKSGVNVSGGQLLVGSGVTIGYAGVATFSGTADIHLHDGVKLLVGDAGSSDASLYHAGGNTYLANATGNLVLGSGGSDTTIKISPVNGEEGIVVTPNTSVDLYYNGSKKFETTNDGTVTTGICSATDFSGLAGGLADFPNGLTSNSTVKVGDSNEFIAGDGNDLRLWHNATDSYIKNYTGDLYIQGDGDDLIMRAADDIAIFTQTSDLAINCLGDGAVELYYDNSKKIETTTSGVTITGNATATKFLGDGSALTGVGGDMDITSSLFV